MRAYALAALATLIAASTASCTALAQENSEARLVTPPSQAAMFDALPILATATGLPGRVVLSCEISTRAEANCTVHEETPANAGFGTAALQLIRSATFAPAVENGSPVTTTILIPINFPGDNVSAPIQAPIHVTAIRGASSVEPLTEAQQRTRHYPQAAHLMEIEGEALVACVVRSARTVDCAVEREEPEGWGFGARAADIISTGASSHPDRQTPGGVSRLRVVFALRDPGEARAPTLEQSEWANAPTAAQRRAAYPAAARSAGREGRVALLCEIQPDRKLNCSVEAETPADQGFGAAALSVAGHYQLRADILGRPGRAAGDRMWLPVRFELAD